MVAMLTKRIIACLDVKDGQVVKGRNFQNLVYAGDPVALASSYNDQGADELVFLDITASVEKRKPLPNLVQRVAKKVFIPLTVGGGITTRDDMRTLLSLGADKVAINTAAVNNPKLIYDAAQKFGSQCIVVAIDAKKVDDSWLVFVNGGRLQTSLQAVEWAKTVAELGAGEILLTSMDSDGTKEGYDLELTKIISGSLTIPVIASGGAGSLQSINDVLTIGAADAALAASIFHSGKYTIAQVKNYLKMSGVEVRI